MKKDVEETTGITHYQMHKLANDKDMTTDVVGTICVALEVRPNDIMDFIQNGKWCPLLYDSNNDKI